MQGQIELAKKLAIGQGISFKEEVKEIEMEIAEIERKMDRFPNLALFHKIVYKIDIMILENKLKILSKLG